MILHQLTGVGTGGSGVGEVAAIYSIIKLTNLIRRALLHSANHMGVGVQREVGAVMSILASVSFVLPCFQSSLLKITVCSFMEILPT